MSVLADASAIVALLTHEPEARALGTQLAQHERRLCCAVGVWEAVRAISRKRDVELTVAQMAVEATLSRLNIALVPIGERECELAIDAHRRYGKGTGHPAQLNMGDCFAYACAKVNEAVLLYKGDDFVHTDLA